MLAVVQPYAMFTETDGSPLEDGNIYIGNINTNPLIEANRVAIYSDTGLVTPLAQPVKTTGGVPVRSGTPTAIYVVGSNYSIVITNKRGELVYSSLNAVAPLAISSASFSFDRSAAEIAANVIPTNFAIPSDDFTGRIDPRRFGADMTGATLSQAQMQVAVSVVRKSACRHLYFPAGTIKVTDLNLCDQYAMTGAGAPDFNDGLKLTGEGKTQSKLLIVPAVNNVGVGVHLVGVARLIARDFWIYSANGASPRVLVLQSKGFQNAAIVFSGLAGWNSCKMTSYGDFTYYCQGSEQTDFFDSELDGAGAGSTACVLSRANTAGITSIYAPLNSPANSMIAVSFDGAGNAIQSFGPTCVLFDCGGLGIGHYKFNMTYFPLFGAATKVFGDTGAPGSLLVDIDASCIIVEFNGGAGTNQVAVLNAATVANCNFYGSSAYSGVAQTQNLFSFSGANIVDNRIDWVVNTLYAPGPPAPPAYVIQTTSGVGRCKFKIDAARSTINLGNSPTASEFVCTDGTYFEGEVRYEGRAVDAVTYDLQRMLSGLSQAGNHDGGIRRQSTTGVSNAGITVIYNGASFGELIVVTGVTGSTGAIFADLLMVGYNAFTVISSTTQQGAPAARTYSVNNNGTLRLTTANANLVDIIVQSYRTGAYGA